MDTDNVHDLDRRINELINIKIERENEVERELYNIEKDKEQLINSYFGVKIAKSVKSSLLVVFIFVTGILILAFPSNFSSIIIVGIILFVWLDSVANNNILKAKEKAYCRAGDAAISLGNRELIALNTKDNISTWYNQETDGIFVNWPTYPPDWQKRKSKVLERDRHHCTQCNWPIGFKRKCRELHVHHIKAISDGGNHSLENLTTLCSICHRKVDEKHRNIQTKSTFIKRNRNRF